MFLVKDRMPERYSQIRRLMKQDPTLGMFAAAANFEWTMHRAISSLSNVSSKTIRKQGQNWHGLEAYSAAWKSYVSPRVASQLSRVIRHWGELRKAFELRNRLVRGGTTNGIEYASRGGETLIEATDDLMQFCKDHDIDLMNGRMGEWKKSSRSNSRSCKRTACRTASCKEGRSCKNTKEGRTATCKEGRPCRTASCKTAPCKTSSKSCKTAACKENRSCKCTSSKRSVACKTSSKASCSGKTARCCSSRTSCRSMSNSRSMNNSHRTTGRSSARRSMR